ncbi:hypothetical protein L798_14631 [Zootermopsis nevadensis]|uniref:Uncharacterized protein n=1 Tax=Zootermopsis nevadensis TaxID=136037 RepID=A0A067QNH9_ZOONE|nr:hypothetical protein L798_14631 [Zootermopsis nevadensis]
MTCKINSSFCCGDTTLEAMPDDDIGDGTKCKFNGAEVTGRDSISFCLVGQFASIAFFATAISTVDVLATLSAEAAFTYSCFLEPQCAFTTRGVVIVVPAALGKL